MRDKIRKYLKNTIVTIILLSIFSYIIFETKEFLMGSSIIISSPINGSSVSNDVLTLVGQAKNTSKLLINGRLVLADSRGNFTEKVILHKGYNSFIFEAKDKFNGDKEKTLEIVFYPEKTASSTENLVKI